MSDAGGAPRPRRRRSRRGCFGCVGCLAPFLLLAAGATLALSFAPRGAADELDLSGITRLIGEGLVNDDGEVRAAPLPGEGTEQVRALLDQLGNAAPSGSPDTEGLLQQLKDQLGGGPAGGAAQPASSTEVAERVFAPRDLPLGSDPAAAAIDPNAPAPEGRVWMWQDTDGNPHITKAPPPKGAKVLSVSDPGSHIKLEVHDDDNQQLEAPAARPPPAGPAPTAPSPQALAASVLKEVNRLRADPAAYAVRLEEVRGTFQGNTYRGVSQRLIQSAEGPSAFDEAIDALRATGPLPPLQPMTACAKSSAAHARWLGRNGKRGHLGKGGERPIDRVKALAPPGSLQAVGEVISYGATLPEEVVMSWLVDDGVSSRGHREALLDPRYTLAGASCHAHLLNPVCVLDLVEPPGR